MLLGGAVERERRVVLLGDVRCVLDPHALHDVTLDVETENVAGVGARHEPAAQLERALAVGHAVDLAAARRADILDDLQATARLEGLLLCPEGAATVTAAVLGAGPIADAFFVALRLPNHFRAIFAEGAFAAAFVPDYSRRLAADA